MASFDRPRHGWEGISHGGEIYGNSGRNNGIVDPEKAYLQAVREALKMSMSDDPDISSKAMGHLRYAQQRYGYSNDDNHMQYGFNAGPSVEELKQANKLAEKVQAEIDAFWKEFDAVFDGDFSPKSRPR